MNAKNRIVAEICLYGTHEIGAGWLASIDPAVDKRDLSAGQSTLGDGEPKSGVCFTDATWAACRAIRAAGVTKGLLHVYAAGGKVCATMNLENPKWFGNLTWEPAPVLTLSYEDILAAAE